MNTQDWSLLGWTGWISLQSKGLSRVFSNTIVQKNQFFGAQFSLQSKFHIHTWPLERKSKSSYPPIKNKLKKKDALQKMQTIFKISPIKYVVKYFQYFVYVFG